LVREKALSSTPTGFEAPLRHRYAGSGEVHGKRTEVRLLQVMDPPIVFDYMYKLNNGDPTTPLGSHELQDDAFWMLVALFEEPKHLQKEYEIKQYLTRIGYS
jgi:hypothetical protein